jgi:hypothetical protein
MLAVPLDLEQVGCGHKVSRRGQNVSSAVILASNVLTTLDILYVLLNEVVYFKIEYILKKNQATLQRKHFVTIFVPKRLALHVPLFNQKLKRSSRIQIRYRGTFLTPVQARSKDCRRVYCIYIYQEGCIIKGIHKGKCKKKSRKEERQIEVDTNCIKIQNVSKTLCMQKSHPGTK